MICVVCIYTRAEAGEVATIVNGQAVCNEHIACAKQNNTLGDMIEFTRIMERPSYSDSVPPVVGDNLMNPRLVDRAEDERAEN